MSLDSNEMPTPAPYIAMTRRRSSVFGMEFPASGPAGSGVRRLQQRSQRQGVGDYALACALKKVYTISLLIGSAAVIVDVESDNVGAQRLYAKAQFKLLKRYTSGGGYELDRLWLPVRNLRPLLP